MTRHRFSKLLSVALFGSVFGCAELMNIEDASCDSEVASCPNEKSALGPSPLCLEYCDTVQSACPADSEAAVYSGRELCLSVCKLLPEGPPGDQFHDTVQCRLEQAKAVLRTNGDDRSGCPGAGPGGEGTPEAGGGVCGSACESFCILYMETCTDSDQFKVFATPEECLDDCATVPDLGGYSTAIAQGDSIQCRLWHLTAATDQPYPHCNHAAGLNTCVDDP